MKYGFVICLLLVSAIAFSGTRTVVTKEVKSDTAAVPKQDNFIAVWDDTVKIVRTLKDTVAVVKIDTVRTSSVPKIVPKVVAPKVDTAKAAPAKVDQKSGK